MHNFLNGFKQIKIFQLFILAGGAGAIYFLPYMRSSYYDVMIEEGQFCGRADLHPLIWNNDQ